MRTIHIDPTGHVKRCPDFPTDFHWRDFKNYEPIACNACFYACRGEAQAPLRLSRVRDVMGAARRADRRGQPAVRERGAGRDLRRPGSRAGAAPR